MQSFNPIYRRFIDGKNKITANQMVRSKFYLIKEYEYVDGTKGKYSESTAPIIFTLLREASFWTIKFSQSISKTS